HGDGCLVGVFPNQDFAEREVQLQAGQRLLIFSDGLEPTLFAPIHFENQPRELTGVVLGAAKGSADHFLSALTRAIDVAPGGLSRADDITLILADIVAPAFVHNQPGGGCTDSSSSFR